MSTVVQPAVADIADLFTWKTVQTIASNSPIGNANRASEQIKILGNSFFCFVAFRGSTNYDAFAGEYKTAALAAALFGDPVVPSNFEAMVKRNNRFQMMDEPMPQGALCSTGYTAGMQVPWPILYPPNTTFNIDVYNVAPVILRTPANAVLSMRIDFGLFGYNVPVENLGIFLDSWPELHQRALSYLTNVKLPSLPG